MKLDRLRWGEWLAAIAAVNLLLVTFRAWYKVGGDGRVTAWNALEQGRYLLIATAVVGIFLFLIKAAGESEKLSFKPGWIAAGVGFACTVYIAYRLAKPPSDALEADIGIYVGLLSALGVTIGGLLSAREPATADLTTDDLATPDADPPTAAAGRATASGATWSPAAPVASTGGWTPASAAVAAVPPAADAARPLRPGDDVILTAGGGRFPAGTVAQIVAVFSGGALVEVKAADGVADRFEVPEQAYQRAPARGAMAPPAVTSRSTAEDSWSPALPAAAGADLGLEPLNGTDADRAGMGAQTDEAPAEKVPWWKREIGGGKKRKRQEAAEVGAAAAVGATAATVPDSDGSAEAKSGFFKRVFGGRKDAPATEAVEAQARSTPEAEPTPVTDVAGTGPAAEADTAVAEPPAESAVDDARPEAASEPQSAAEPETAAAAPAAPSDADDALSAAPPRAEPDSDDALPAAPPPAEPDADDALPAAPPPAEPDAADALSAAPPHAEPDAAAAAMAPDPEAEPANAPAPTASTPEADADSAPTAPEEPAAADAEPPGSGRPTGAPSPDAGIGAAAAGAAAAGNGHDKEPEPTRKRSSGTRAIPKEVLAAFSSHSQPKVGDEVQLKVGAGRFDAGTHGTVVDVFSAGVIVELSGEGGRSERLDLPFEAIAPADE